MILLNLGMFIILITLGVIIGMFIIYIGLIKKRNTVKEAFASIDVQLKKRYDLIPNILTIANKFMEHEKEVFNKIAEYRAQALRLPNDVKYAEQKMELDNKISDCIKQIQVNAENYPQLKSDKTMLQAMRTFNYTEEYIAAARRYYNASVKDLNNAVEIFPSSIIASLLGIRKADFIKAEAHEKEHISGQSYFK